jgi:DNA sulfur modification protein DndB
MNDGVTVCINVLRSVLYHLQSTKRIRLGTLSNSELIEVIAPWARIVGAYFSSFTPDQMIQFRALRGVQGQTTGTRRLEEAIQRSQTDFDPPGLEEFLKREKAQTTAQAYEQIKAIEQILQSTVLGELKSEFGANGEDWWFAGVPKGVRKKVDDRINEEAGKSGGREQNFDFIDYREIIHENWALFETALARGTGKKENRTKWIVEVNDLRKRVMHASKGQSLPISEEQLFLLNDIRQWLESQIGSQERS